MRMHITACFFVVIKQENNIIKMLTSVFENAILCDCTRLQGTL